LLQLRYSWRDHPYLPVMAAAARQRRLKSLHVLRVRKEKTAKHALQRKLKRSAVLIALKRAAKRNSWLTYVIASEMVHSESLSKLEGLFLEIIEKSEIKFAAISARRYGFYTLSREAKWIIMS